MTPSTITAEDILRAREQSRNWRQSAIELNNKADSLDKQTDEMARKRLLDTRLQLQPIVPLMRFRQQRGTFAESIKTTVYIPRTREAIAVVLNQGNYNQLVSPKYLYVTPYGFEEREPWNAGLYLVMHMGAVVGLTDHPLVTK